MRVLSCLAAVAALSACSAYAPPHPVAGTTRDELVARMGPPETQRPVDGGTRLEFPRGPLGVHTWFVYLDASGRAIRSEQVLNEATFNRILPGMTQEQVRQILGRPGDVGRLARSRGHVWSYRYENNSCLWFQVELAADQTVRSAGFGEPPECSKPGDSAFL